MTITIWLGHWKIITVTVTRHEPPQWSWTNTPTVSFEENTWGDGYGTSTGYTINEGGVTKHGTITTHNPDGTDPDEF